MGELNFHNYMSKHDGNQEDRSDSWSFYISKMFKNQSKPPPKQETHISCTKHKDQFMVQAWYKV